MGFKLNGKHVQYNEVPPSSVGPGYLFDVVVDGVEYQLAMNRAGQVAATGDHPIVQNHRDVVEEILRRESSRWGK